MVNCRKMKFDLVISLRSCFNRQPATNGCLIERMFTFKFSCFCVAKWRKHFYKLVYITALGEPPPYSNFICFIFCCMLVLCWYKDIVVSTVLHTWRLALMCCRNCNYGRKWIKPSTFIHIWSSTNWSNQ